MSAGYQALSEKEKQTLRLIVRGHDAKSLARHLDLSVHTVNERLRDARRKMGVSSSREAARILLEKESADPDSFADKRLGEARSPTGMGQSGARNANLRTGHRLAILAGGMIMLLSLALLSSMTLLDAPTSAISEPVTTPVAASATTASDVTETALRWLALVDGQQWQASWSETGSSFRQLNTVQAWEAASEGGRVPLGGVVKRIFGSQEDVPAPPHGYRMIKFRTSFQNKSNATETLSLVREGARWRVVGYIID